MKIKFTTLAGLATVTAIAFTSLVSTPAIAASDEHGNTFNISQKTVHVVGNRCGKINFKVDGWSAGWDADYLMGTAFVSTSGVVGNDIEAYDWWDWSQDGWHNLTWQGTKKICTKADKTLTGKASFDVFGYDYEDGYNTVLKDTVRVNYHPVKVKVTQNKKVVKVKVWKDGKPFKNVKVSGKGVTRKTNSKGIAKLPKSALPTNKKVTFIVGGDIAKKRVKVKG